MNFIDLTGRRRVLAALDQMSGLDWEDLASVHDAFAVAAPALCDPNGLRHLFDELLTDPALLDKSERRNWGDRLVLFDALEDRGFRIRLHHWADADEDPHNHRWSFAAAVIRGGYFHSVYGLESQVASRLDRGPFDPDHVRRELPGDFYCMSHDMMHATRPLDGSVSLMLRGPTARATNIMVDRTTGSISTLKFGAKDETPEQRAAVATSAERVAHVMADFRASGILA